MNSGRIFIEPRSGEVNILPLFTEIEKNNCFSIYTRSDLKTDNLDIFKRKPMKGNFIREVKHDVYGKRQTAKIILILLTFSLALK